MQPHVEEIRNAPEPLEALERIAALPFPLLLESATAHPEIGRHSYLMADPFRVIRSRVGDAAPADGADPFVEVRAALQPFALPALPGLPPFQGGAAGYFGYDLGRSLERIPPHRVDDLHLPDLVLGLYDWTLAWDHRRGRCWIVSTGLPAAGDERGARAADRAREILRLLEGERRSGRVDAPRAPGGRSASLADTEASPATPAPAGRGGGTLPREADSGQSGPRVDERKVLVEEAVPDLPGIVSGTTREGYLQGVERVREYIRAGDIFQANLSQRLHAPAPADPLTLYRRVRERSPAPYAAFFDTGEAALVSASPELFLRLRGDAVETRPIKGTAPRHPDPEEDARSARRLAESEKDRAENVMIVDLLRNDLSRVCTDDSVEVPRLCAVESHGPVHHLVSTVTGRLRPECDAIDLLRAAFPGGSITGAPKIRAMEIIAELETTRRGPYTGSIGYIGFDGSMETSIVIRTFVVKEGTAFFQVGGGIVADSDPAREYEETLHKAAALAAALEVTG